MLLYGVMAIPLFFSFGMMYNPGTNFAIADFWRWWVVHLWVEGIFELYTTIIVAYFFCSLGHGFGEVGFVGNLCGHLVISRQRNRRHRVTITTGLHNRQSIWRSAQWYPPWKLCHLTLLTMEAWKFIELAKVEGSIKNFSHYWAMMFLLQSVSGIS